MTLLRSLALLVYILIGHLSAQTFTVLHTFTGTPDGSYPQAGVTLSSSGDLYGITSSGGQQGRGVIYKIDQFGNEAILHNLTNHDGCCAYAGLSLDSSGNLYGTTVGDAIGTEGGIFRLRTSGKFDLLHTFGADGDDPESNLLKTPGGILYGTTVYGGYMDNGIVFSINPKTRAYTVVHEFMGSDGAFPSGNLVADSAGNIYGATAGGGDFGHGVVYQLAPSGSVTVLHSFLIDGMSGAGPLGGLIMGRDRALYGTTAQGGQFGFGTIFRLTLDGQETELYSFGESSPDGAVPFSSVIQDSSGNLYGTTYQGGTMGHGSVYEFDTTGKLTLLHSFTLGTDGENPIAGLTSDSLGNLYGTTSKGSGSSFYGTVFVVTP